MHRPALVAAALALLTSAGLSRAEAVGAIHTCVGRSGALRLVEGAHDCRPAERPLAWQRGGGAWVHDANGRPLGRSMGAGWLFIEPGDIRVRLSSFTGDLCSSSTASWVTTSSGRSSRSAGPSARGRPSATTGPSSGSSSRGHAPRPVCSSAFGSRRSGRSPILDPVSGCIPAPSFFVPLASTVVEDFSGMVPFETPVERPLRVGSGLE